MVIFKEVCFIYGLWKRYPPLIRAFGKQRQVDLCVFEGSLVYSEFQGNQSYIATVRWGWGLD